MIEEYGRVIALDEGLVWLEAVRRTGCGRCDEPGGCGSGGFARVARERSAHVRALNPEGLMLKVGDQVAVGIPEGTLRDGALLIYGAPVGCLLAGVWLGNIVLAGDAGSLGGAALGLLTGFALVRYGSAKMAMNPDAQPVVLRRVDAEPPASCGR